MTTQPHVSPLKVRLEVLPERQHVDEDVALTMEIKRDIFMHLKDLHYSIEPAYTKAMGWNELLITFESIAPILLTAAAVKLADAAETKVVDSAFEKIVDMIKHIIDKLKQSKHTNLPAEVAVIAPNEHEIHTHGLLVPALNEMIIGLEKQMEQMAQTNHDETATEITTEISFTIKVSRSHTRHQP